MSVTLLRTNHRTTLPQDMVEAAGLKPNDQVDWRFDDGEIRGRKLEPKKVRPTFPHGSLLKYLTPEREKEQDLIFQATVKGLKLRLFDSLGRRVGQTG